MYRLYQYLDSIDMDIELDLCPSLYLADLALDSHGGGFSGPIVTQEGGDLSLVEAECQSIHCQLLAMTINLH